MHLTQEPSGKADCKSFISVCDVYVLAIAFLAILGALCLLGGLVLLCVVSKSLNDQQSEAMLLSGIGFFVVILCFITWKLTAKRRITMLENMERSFC